MGSQPVKETIAMPYSPISQELKAIRQYSNMNVT